MKHGRWYRIAMTALALLLVLLLAASYRYLVSRGVFASVKPAPLVCRTLPLAVADIAVDPATKHAFLAAPDGLYAYAYQQPGARPERLSGMPPDFHPTALALYRASAGEATLYAVNRRGNDYSLVSFRLSTADGKPRLQEKSRIGGRILNQPSAIAAVDDLRFYVTNRHASRTSLGRWLDDAFLLPRANVLYFNGMLFREVATRLNSPGGVALSPDGGRLVVSEFYPRRLVTFLRNPFTGALDDAEALPLKAGPGQTNNAADSLIVAATPKAGSGAVFRISYKAGVPQAAVPLYASRDGEIAAAAVTGGGLLIGAATGLKDCALPKQ
jgi:arylesterase / paraoxonase